MTSGRKDIKDFDPPSGVLLGRVQRNEAYVEVPTGETNALYIINAESRAIQEVLPRDLIDVPLLTLCLDQGSIGAAGVSFLLEKQKMVHIRYDKFHRLVRDVRQSLKYASGGRYLKAQLFSSMIFGLNYRPFGTGLFWQQKKRMMEVFLDNEGDKDDPTFRKFAQRIATDLGIEGVCAYGNAIHP